MHIDKLGLVCYTKIRQDAGQVALKKFFRLFGAGKADKRRSKWCKMLWKAAFSRDIELFYINNVEKGLDKSKKSVIVKMTTEYVTGNNDNTLCNGSVTASVFDSVCA